MINDLTKAVFGKKLHQQMTVAETLSLLQDLDLINVGELAEKAVAKKAGVAQARKCEAGYDLVNGWEIKHGQAHESNGNYRRAYVGSLHNKTCTLRVIITERLTGKLYYFKVPYSAYKNYKSSSLNWNFYNDGSPAREKKISSSRPNFWDYEVASFKDLCV